MSAQGPINVKDLRVLAMIWRGDRISDGTSGIYHCLSRIMKLRLSMQVQLWMERFPEPHVKQLMDEFYRILQPKGTVEIYVPNLTNSAILLIAARVLSLKTLPSRGNIYGTQANYEDPETRHLSYFFRLHKYGYTAPILRSILMGAGFGEVKVTGDSHWKRVTET